MTDRSCPFSILKLFKDVKGQLLPVIDTSKSPKDVGNTLHMNIPSLKNLEVECFVGQS